MRHIRLCVLLPTLVLNPCLVSAGTLAVPDAKIGNNLEVPVMARLDDAASDPGLDVTVRSADPGKLLVAKSSEEAGAASVVLRVRPGFRATPEFWLQGLAQSGTVSYSVEAPGFGTAKGTVTLTPSGIALRGPYSAPKFITTPRAMPAPIRLTIVRLDESSKIAQEQVVAGGRTVRVEVVSSNPAVGRIAESPIEIKGGTNAALAEFRPAGVGETTLSVKADGFIVPAEYASTVADVQQPKLAVTDGIIVGRNLEAAGVLIVTEPPPGDGVDVTLTTDDPGRLLLSVAATDPGAKSIKVKMPPDGKTQRFYLQALGNSGTVTYKASAPGYQSRTGTVTLAPSGILFTPAAKGPPDEAHVLREEGAGGDMLKMMYPLDLSSAKPEPFVAWTAQLDPKSHRGADITVQPLRGGFTIKVPLSNSKPAVGTIAPSITIQGGVDHGMADFKPLAAGSAEVSVGTPEEFIPAANSTTIVAVVH
jgi:hypothetical protein